MTSMRLAAGTFLAACLAGTAAAQTAPTYRITDLGTLAPGDVGYAPSSFRVDAHGVVAGTLGTDSPHCVVFDHGKRTDIGSLGGGLCQVSAVNAKGTVVGESSTAQGQWHAFVFRDGAMTDMGTWAGDDGSEAIDINAGGTIVGHSWSDTAFRIVSTRKHRGTDVTAASRSEMIAAFAINNAGQIAGMGGNVNWPHAYVYANGVSTDLGTFDGGYESLATAINNLGQVAGWSEGAVFSRRAFRYADGVMTDLGYVGTDSVAPSQASAINDTGWVVGTADYNRDQSGQVGFLHDGQAMHDINLLLEPKDAQRWHVITATSINNAGQIAGLAQSYGDSATHVYLATPVR